MRAENILFSRENAEMLVGRSLRFPNIFWGRVRTYAVLAKFQFILNTNWIYSMTPTANHQPTIFSVAAL